jgi:predicted nucleotidyltransferase
MGFARCVCNTNTKSAPKIKGTKEVTCMIDIDAWMDQFLQALNKNFKDRVWFVGLQGRYGRGEATPTSDVDLVVILDELSAADIGVYNSMLNTLSHREMLCGFLCGKNEIMHWEPSDLFQFYHDTIPIQGNLDELLPLIDADAVARAIKIGACNIFHGCIHNMLYDRNDEILKGLYKSASFVVQAICFQQTGTYVKRQKDLLRVVSLDEQVIINIFMDLKNGGMINFQGMSEILVEWSKTWIESV